MRPTATQMIITFALFFALSTAYADHISGDTWSSNDGRLSWKPPAWVPGFKSAHEITNQRREGITKKWKFDSGAKSTGMALAGSLTAQVDPGLSIAAQTTFTQSLDKGNDVEINAAITLKSAPCNLLDMTFTASGSITFSLGLTTKGDCIEGNVNQCFYDAMKKVDGKTVKTWVSKFTGCSTWSDSSFSSCILTELKIDMGTFTKTINFGQDITKLKFKLSSLLSDIGKAGSETGVLVAAAAIGKIMAYTGTDVMWFVTPGSMVTMFTGVQFAITMEVVAFDLAASTLPDKSDVKTALGLLGAPLSNLATKPLFLDNLDFVNFVLKYVPKVDIPSFATKDSSGYYRLTIGTVNKDCTKDPSSFGLSIAGIPTGSSAADISKELIKIVKTTATSDMKAMLANCDQQSFPMSIPSSTTVNDFTQSSTTAATKLVCIFQDVAVKSRRDGTTSITGSTNAGAGMNAGGLNAVLKQAISKGTSITLGGKSFDIPKTQTGITVCTAAEKTAAGSTGGCGDLSAAATTSAATKGSPTSSGGLSGGGIAAIVITIVIVTLCIVLAVLYCMGYIRIPQGEPADKDLAKEHGKAVVVTTTA